MGLLKPIVDGQIRAITWKNDHGGFEKLGIIPSASGIQFVKRDDQGKLAGLFVAYTCTPTMFGGYRLGPPASSMRLTVEDVPELWATKLGLHGAARRSTPGESARLMSMSGPVRGAVNMEITAQKTTACLACRVLA